MGGRGGRVVTTDEKGVFIQKPKTIVSTLLSMIACP